ncbi:hypothetical protein [Croceitalea rosinachiae]|uniref:Bulb-type lectin domain-containing protein n=1 Tax=Croceitalea rosinachiae TaxID=3075596 RepID=A0ABU3A8M8_9FLAO|nr:hypothetical protein [Croceitalea sp. F388]MDT0606155.1 hypothetical protein [Croceitalea sp. F388]
MRKIFGFLSVFLLFACSSDDSGNDSSNNDDDLRDFGSVAWIQNFGGSGNDTPRSVMPTSDGGFAVFGFTNSTDGDLADKSLAVNDYWFLKFDTEGSLQWNRTYGGSKDDRGQQAIQTSDGGYAITGYAMSDDGDGSNNEGFHDNWILKLDTSGNILWEKSFGFSGHDHSYDIIETVDGGFFFSGFLDVTSSNGEGSTDKSRETAHGVGEFWGTRIDANGDLIWQKYFGGTNNDRSFGVMNANDGGFILSGASESDDFDISDPKGSYDYWVVKVDKNGNLEWEKSFGGTGIDQSHDIVKTNDGAYAIIGNTFSRDAQVSKNNGESDIWLVKFDDNGELLWEQSYGGPAFDAAHSISLANDGGFIISGNSKSFGNDVTANFGENDLWIITTDPDGKIKWQKTIGGTGLDFGYDAFETVDGSLIFVGETESTDFPEIEHKGGLDLVVLKIE